MEKRDVSKLKFPLRGGADMGVAYGFIFGLWFGDREGVEVVMMPDYEIKKKKSTNRGYSK